MSVATIADAKVFTLHGFTFRPLAVPSRGSTDLAVWLVEVAPGAISEVHSMDREEIFVVQRGRLVADVGGRHCDVGVGDALIVPAHTALEVRNGHDGPTLLTVCTSVGMKATIAGKMIAPPWAQ